MYPDANVALRTGVKFWVLDVDLQHGGEESYRRLVYKYGAMETTLQQKTGGGGSQYFYEQPDQAVIIGKAPLYDDWPGIDARGQNNYVIAPPSIHPNGNEYLWDTARRTILEEPIVPANGWLLEWVLASANGTKGASHGFQPPPEKIPHGQQHRYLVSEAGKLRDLGMGYEEIVECIWQTNLKRCEQPGPRKNIEQIARSVMKYTPKRAHTVNGKPGVARPVSHPCRLRSGASRGTAAGRRKERSSRRKGRAEAGNSGCGAARQNRAVYPALCRPAGECLPPGEPRGRSPRTPSRSSRRFPTSPR